MMEETKTPNEYQKRRAAMAKRMSSLGKGNPVVAKAIEMQKPPEEDTKWKEWEIVDELVSAARRKYMDESGGSMKKCVSNLAKALMSLASK